MLILADGEHVSDLIPQDDSISLVAKSEAERPRTVGEKRNLGCLLLNGVDIIAVFDDDDWSAPTRIEEQVALLAQTGKRVTGYHTMRFTDGKKLWIYAGEPHSAMGASLCFRQSWWETHRFEHRQIGQDEAFAETARSCGQLISVDAGSAMFASIHPKNTSPRRNFENPWRALGAWQAKQDMAWPPIPGSPA